MAVTINYNAAQRNSIISTHGPALATRLVMSETVAGVRLMMASCHLSPLYTASPRPTVCFIIIPIVLRTFGLSQNKKELYQTKSI